MDAPELLIVDNTWTYSIPEENHPPTAVAATNQVADEGVSVALNGNGSSDPDGDDLYFTWTHLSGPEVKLLGADQPMPSFVASTATWRGATLTFLLEVSDGEFSTMDQVSVVIRDVNRATWDGGGAGR